MAIKRFTVDLSAVTAFPSTAQCVFEFTPSEIQIVDLHATEAVDVSFDGTTIHYQLTPATLTAGVVLMQRATKVWLRRSSAVGSPSGVNVQVVGEN